MLSLNLVTFVPCAPGTSQVEEITEEAVCHKSWAALGLRVFLLQEVKEALVDWTERDARRSDTGDEITPETRLHNLLAEAATAVRGLKHGEQQQIFLAEYFDRAKRGNPRRTQVRLCRNDDVVIIDFPA